MSNVSYPPSYDHFGSIGFLLRMQGALKRMPIQMTLIQNRWNKSNKIPAKDRR